jgi:hypothetical protein
MMRAKRDDGENTFSSYYVRPKLENVAVDYGVFSKRLADLITDISAVR